QLFHEAKKGSGESRHQGAESETRNAGSTWHLDRHLQHHARHQGSPGILRPPIIPPIFCDICSSAFRCASLTAARIRSCSISTSSFETTSGSILIDCSCFAPLTTTVTMPPPEVASTFSSAICFCRRSCICCACFIIC